MKAGRELDALVAEHVMEWEQGFNGNGESCWFDKNDNWMAWANNDFSPSINISDAWQVVEKLKSEMDSVQICTASNNNWFVWTHDSFSRNNVEAETAPLAICLASLKAKGIDIDE